jgi:deglycase
MADQPLRARKVAILLATAGTEQVELTEPKKAVEGAGAEVDLVGAHAGPARTVNHDLDPGRPFRSTGPSTRSPPTTMTP